MFFRYRDTKDGGLELRDMKNFQYSVFFEFFVIAIFVCHFVYLATSSEDLKEII